MNFNDKKIEQLSDGMAKAVTEGIAASMRPVFEELTGQVRQMMEGIEARQEANIERMADAFLEEMKKSCATMFADMTAGMKEVCDKQQKVCDSLQKAIDHIEKSTGEASAAEQGIAGALADMKQMQNAIQSTVTAQHGEITAMSANMAGYCESVGKSVDKFIDAQQSYATDTVTLLDNKQKEWVKASENMSASADELQKYIAEVKNVTDTLNDNLQQYIATVTEESSKYRTLVNNDVEATFKAFDTEMAGIAKTLGDVAGQIKESSEKIPRALKGSIDELERAVKR